MPFEIASLNSSDTTLKVLRGKPFSISLSSFLSVSADETGSSIDFSSASNNTGSSNYNNDGVMFSANFLTLTVPASTSASSTHGTWTVAPTRFAAITCGGLPSGVSFFKETIGMVRYCDPLDLLIDVYPSNSRLQGSIDTAGTYEFYLIADIVSVPINTYVIATTQSPFNLLPHLNPSSYSNVTSSSWTGPYPNIPIQVGYDITKNLVRLSSDTIKVTLIVEEVPTSVVVIPPTTPVTPPTIPGVDEYIFLSPEFYGTASTGSSTSSVDLHTDPVTTSLLTTTSKSINIQYNTTRTATDNAQAQTYNVVFGGASVLNSPFSFSSASATTASVSVQIKRTSSSYYKVDSVINYSSGGGTPLTKTFSKNISLSSLSGNDLIFQVTNNVGGSSPVISTRSAIALVS